MRAARGPGRGLVVLATALVAACASAPKAPSPERVDAPIAATAGFERVLAARADEEDKAARWADEAITLELLTLVAPSSVEHRTRLDAVRTRIRDGVRAAKLKGADATKRGQLDLATASYLAALVLDPDDREAADALRAIEVDRSRRQLAAKLRRAPQPAPANGD